MPVQAEAEVHVGAVVQEPDPPRARAQAGLMQTEEDRVGARKVLTAAGLTYLAAAVTSILQLLWYISIAQRRR